MKIEDHKNLETQTKLKYVLKAKDVKVPNL